MPVPQPPYPHDPRTGPRWHIEARKYDGTLHYTLPAHLVEDDGQRIWLHTPTGTPLHHVTRGFERPMRHASELLFWRGTGYNIYANYAPGGALDYFYCNVSLPPHIDGTTLTFVDIDLDVAIRPDGTVSLLDADEFAAHCARYGYPRKVQRDAWHAVLAIFAHWHARRPPFNWFEDRLDDPQTGRA